MPLSQIVSASIEDGAVAPVDLSSVAQYTGFKNRLINGAMVIDQRNNGAAVTPTIGTYTLDRWTFYVSQASKLTTQQNAGSVTPPAGFTKYLGITSSSAYSITSTDLFLLRTFIEGFNTADLAWGTASAATVTLSFWVRSSLTGTFGGCIANSGNARAYPFTYTISAANTWEQKSVTIAGDTSGTWATDNTLGIGVNFNLGTGSTYSGAAGSWTGGPVYAPTGTVSVVGTNGATFYITGVQLEKGVTATSFDYRPYGTEFLLCQRYYQYIANGDALIAYTYSAYYSSNRYRYEQFIVPMRTTPTMTGTPGSDAGYTATVLAANSLGSFAIQMTMNATNSYGFYSNIRASAEL